MSTDINIKKRIDIQEEGVSITPDVNSINFIGSGVSASTVGDNVTVNIPGSIGATGYYLNESITQTPYKEFSSIPTAIAEQTIATVVGVGATATVQSFQTPSGIPGTTNIPAGLWLFYLHYSGTFGDSWDVYAEVYKRDLGGIETLLLTSDVVTTTTLNATPIMTLVDGVFPASTLLTTDRIVIKLLVTNTGVAGQTITFHTEGSTNYSIVSTTLNQVVPTGGVTAVTGTAPVVSSGGTTPAISMAQADTVTDGYLSSTDWNTFNNKVDDNIYTADGTLSGNRTVTVNSNTLLFDGTNSYVKYTPNSAGGYLQLEGKASAVPRFSVSIPPYLTKPLAGFQLGMRAWDDPSFPGYGQVGDAFFYAGNATYGLNFLNPPGVGTADYIRFYAGIDATGTSHIHIQGTGATKGYVGLGTETPTKKLHINNGDILVQNTNGSYTSEIQNATGPLVLLDGNNTGVTRFGVRVPTYDSITLGVRGPSAGLPGYGKVGDGFIYSSSANNGINLVSATGVGTDDYIRFYAGQTADGTVPDLYIQGNGVTRGYVGIGTDTPTEKLEVTGNTKLNGTLSVNDSSATLNVVGNAFGQASLITPTGALIFTAGYGGVNINGANPNLQVDGKTTTSTFQLTTTPTAGYVLTSDASGNGTWQANGNGTVTSVGLTAGTGISLGGTNPITSSGSITVTNSAPDQTVVLNNGSGINVTGTYPNFTIANTAPDQTVALTAGTGIGVTGTYPNFTISNTDPTTGVTLTSAGGSQSLVNDGTGPSLAVKGLTAGGGILLTPSVGNDFISIVNTSPATGVTLTSAGGTETLVNDGTGPTLATKGVTAGTGISLSSTATDLTVTNSAPDQVVALTAGTGINVTGTYPNFTIDNTNPATITGSGTANYLARWTPSGTQLGVGVIRDDGTYVGVGTAPVTGTTGYKFYLRSTSEVSVGVYSVLPTSVSTTATTYAVAGFNQNSGSGDKFGTRGFANNGTGLNVGVEATAQSLQPTATNIGIVSNASSGLSNYAAKLTDGTEGINKFLKSVTADGKTNWADITVADTGLILTTTGTSGAATLVGDTLNIPQYSSTWNVTTQAGASYTAASNDYVLVNAATHTVTLPAAANGIRVGVKMINATVTDIRVLTPSAGITIDGVNRSVTGLPIFNQYDAYTFVSDGTNWWIMG